MSKEFKCVSCGKVMTGQYCSHCGEQRLSPDLRSIKHILKDLVTDLTSIDSKLWRTLRTLFFKPGQLDYDYHIGKRVNYIKPITLFLLFNVLFVMLSPITDFYLSFYDQLNAQQYSPYIKPFIANYITEQQATLESYEKSYNQLVKVLARSLIILQVPVFALLTAFICWKKNLFSGDYLTYGLNFNSWMLAWIVFMQVPANLLGFMNLTFIDENFTSIIFGILLLGLLIYLWLSAKKLFQFSFIGLLWRVPLLFAALAISHLTFRFLQFVITFSLVKV